MSDALRKAAGELVHCYRQGAGVCDLEIEGLEAALAEPQRQPPSREELRDLLDVLAERGKNAPTDDLAARHDYESETQDMIEKLRDLLAPESGA